GMGEALGKAVRLFHYVPQANCLPGKTNYIMKLGQTQNFGHSQNSSASDFFLFAERQDFVYRT
ncbi:hypothetical protein, partial [Turicimonas muris]